jgi:PAS domain S-box-containing protein
MMLIYLGLFVVLITLYSDVNPCSQIPFSGPQSKIAVTKSAYKMIVVLFYNLDYKGDYVAYFIGFCAASALLLLAYRYKRIIYYRKSVNTFSAIMDVALAWGYVCVLIHIVFNDGNSKIGLVYMVLLSPFACLAYLFILDKRKFHVIKSNAKGLKKDEDVEIFVNVVLELIEKSDTDSNKIKLEGMLKNYQKNGVADGQELQIIKELTDDGPMGEDNTDKLSAWYRLLRSIIEQSLKKFTKSPRLRLLLAYLQHEKMKNKFKSLFELMQAAEMKPNYQEEFSIYRYKMIIEEEMIEADMRNNNEMNGMDVNQMVQFQNYYVKFVSTIEKAVKLHYEFWKELLEESPDIKKLESLGSSITKIVEDSRKQFDVLSDINSNHHKCLDLFGRFLKEVVNDDINGQRIIEKAQKVSKQINQRQAGEELSKFEEHSDTAIITISGNFRQIGIITNSNNQITNLLGYNKNELVGEKIETIMPKIFADNHDDLLLKYFDNPDRQLNIERTVHSMNKKGYIIPCSLLAKILPNLDYGIQIVGFLRQLPGFDPEKDKYVVYSCESGMIYGVTRACYEHFGIRASLTYGKCYNMSELNFDLLCPEILEESKQQTLKSANGMTVLLDTTSIQANHPLENEDDESINENKADEVEEKEVKAGEQKAKRYKKYQVKAKITEDRKWFDGKLRVNVLKLTETGKDADSGEESEQEEKANNQGLDKDRRVEQVDEVEHANEGPGNESVNNNDLGSSQISNEANNADIKAIKDFRAMFAEKNVPRTIKNLNRIFYSFIILLFAVSGLLIYFFSINKTIVSNANSSIQVSNSRHSLLAEINFFVRKLHLIGTNTMTTGKDEQATKDRIKDKSNQLQQVQFQVVESIHRMNSDLNKDVTVKEIVNYASNDPTKEDTIMSAYESTLFQFTSETFQVNNATLTDIDASYSGTALNDTTKNIRKAFLGIFNNGLRYLRSASIQISQEMYDNYIASIKKAFLIQTLLISCIGMFLVVLGTILLVPTVFKVMNTTTKVLTLFGRIEQKDIIKLSVKCEQFNDEMFSEYDKKKIADPILPKTNEVTDTNKDNLIRAPESGLPLPAGVGNNDEGFDVKTEKPATALPIVTTGLGPMPVAQLVTTQPIGVSALDAKSKNTLPERKKSGLASENNNQPADEEQKSLKKNEKDKDPKAKKIAKDKDAKKTKKQRDEERKQEEVE